MNDIRKIIISNGWGPDQNNALAEVVIPSTIKTLNTPRKITFLGDTLGYIPSTAAALEELDAPNATSCSVKFNGYSALNSVSLAIASITDSATTAAAGMFLNCGNLQAVNLPYLTSIKCLASGGATMVAAFGNNTSLTSISLPALTYLETLGDGSSSGTHGAFCGCTALTNISLPSLTQIYEHGAYGSYGAFNGCTSLTTITLPKINTITTTWRRGPFNGCTSLESVQLGSEGNPVSSIGNVTFNDLTQSALTITIYTSGGAALSGSPWGATNATIEYEEA